MKKLMLMAYGICFVLALSTLSAQKISRNWIGPQDSQTNKSYNDTLIINLQGSDKILLVGKTLLPMVDWMIPLTDWIFLGAKCRRADSLKMLFLNDFEKAVSENLIPKEVQRVHYFVHGSGKRRLKAETPEYTDNKVDVSYEIQRLNLDIPQYQYIIHDLSYLGGYELHIYINDPGQLRNILNAANFNEVAQLIEMDKKTLRNCYKVEIKADDDDYKISKKTGSWRRLFSGSPNMGISILGNVVAPVLGGTFGLVWNDKYSVGKHKLDFCSNVLPIVEMNSGKITGVSMIRSYDLKYMFNIDRYAHRERWWGMQAGFMKSNPLSSFNNAYKFGIVFAKPGIGSYSLEIITYKYNKGFFNSLIYNKDFIYGLTWTFPFL
jgi:hypothetical protein